MSHPYDNRNTVDSFVIHWTGGKTTAEATIGFGGMAKNC